MFVVAFDLLGELCAKLIRNCANMIIYGASRCSSSPFLPLRGTRSPESFRVTGHLEVIHTHLHRHPQDCSIFKIPKRVILGAHEKQVDATRG